MTPNEITELEWLASSLAGVASKLLRTAKLLRCERDLERAEARLAAIAAATGEQAKAAAAAAAASAARGPTAIPAESHSGAALAPVGGSRTAAVFDVDGLASSKRPKISTGVRRAPF